MMTGECCCLVSTGLRMCWLMTKMILSLLEYILSFICILYISHCILDEVLKWLKWLINCCSFALAHRVRVCVYVFIGVWVCVRGECRSCTVWSKKTTDALCLAAFNGWGGLGSDRQSNQGLRWAWFRWTDQPRPWTQACLDIDFPLEHPVRCCVIYPVLRVQGGKRPGFRVQSGNVNSAHSSGR